MERLIPLLNLWFSCSCNNFWSLPSNKYLYHLYCRTNMPWKVCTAAQEWSTQHPWHCLSRGEDWEVSLLNFHFTKQQDPTTAHLSFSHMQVKIVLFTLLTAVPNSAHGRGDERSWSLRSPPTQTILWLYEKSVYTIFHLTTDLAVWG